MWASVGFVATVIQILWRPSYVRTATVSKVVRRPPYFQQNVQKASDAVFRPAAYTPLWAKWEKGMHHPPAAFRTAVRQVMHSLPG